MFVPVKVGVLSAALFAAGVSTAACQGTTMKVEDLQGRWVLQSVNGQPAESKPEVYFEISGDKISGYDGCNRFGGSTSQLGRVFSTRRGCPPDFVAPIDTSRLEAQLTSGQRDGDTLSLPLLGAEAGGTVVFQRSDAQ